MLWCPCYVEYVTRQLGFRTRRRNLEPESETPVPSRISGAFDQRHIPVDSNLGPKLQAMSSTSADALAEGDHIVRPRPRKLLQQQLSHLSQISNASELNGNPGALELPETGHVTATTSGRSTPIPLDAPPSVYSLSTARKQVRAEQRRRIFPTIEYASRVSHFDPNSDYRDFHGFFNLFWIGLAIMAITSMLRNIKDTGSPMRVQIWGLFTVNLWHLAIADFMMVASTAVSLPLHRVFRAAPARGALTWAKGGVALMSLYQAVWLAFWISVPFVLEWAWTAQVFLLLHTMVLLMKMHSYSFYNGHLSETEKRLRALDDPSTASRAPAYLYPTLDNPEGTVASPTRAEARGKGGGNRPEDDEIAQLREDLARELTSPIGNITYPANLTWANYLDYLCCPTLCYEIEYPRTEAIDWQNLLSKIAATFGCIFLLTIISEEFILPALTDASHRLDPSLRTAESPLTALEASIVLLETISWLLFPFMLTFLLVFLVIFEYVLGACAEITHFADRHFYSDWWNSTDWMEFSREWVCQTNVF